jgi:hypothetical protein
VSNPIHAPVSAPNPFKNPSYPQRIHLSERTTLQEILRSCDERLGQVRQSLDAIGDSGKRAASDRLFLQLQGARDQIADAVRRMPLEAGALYHEDQERLHVATEAFERLFKRWSA